MSDRFRPLGAEALAAWIAAELKGANSVFGIPRELWFEPSPGHRYGLELRGTALDTPIGVAAGPHTQLAQNIVVAWLCGARVIELKTVQTLDRIEVSKPCIDMQDGGYNIEWSQELTVEESFDEYLKSWVLIHAVHAHLGRPEPTPGVLFDLSVGYDLDGIRRPNMQWFLDRMADAGEEIDRCVAAVQRAFPGLGELRVPSRIADSVTLSTLHGCPPEEIGAIARYLLEERDLHTAVKLNPTLIGYDAVREILVEDLGWSEVEPVRDAFDSDIGYPEALSLISELETVSRGCDRMFGLKLCNTLPVTNARPDFDSEESIAYLSGRPLHALAVVLAHRLTRDTDTDIAISFAGGADAFNTPHLLAAGLRPVTICSDLLRPGGYLRMRQYLEEIDAAFDTHGAGDLDELIRLSSGIEGSVSAAALHNLGKYADQVRLDPEFHRDTYRRNRTKTDRTLGFFDCVEAPCMDACSIGQHVPEYMRRVASGDLDGAAAVIGRDNPLPTILGRACHHPCEPVCLRTHLDQPLAIREIKRFVTDNAGPSVEEPTVPAGGPKVGIIGAGPCGLAAAAELTRSGARVVLFESRDEAGGMVSATIPGYRASRTAIQRDFDAIAALGMEIEFGVRVGRDLSLVELFQRGFDALVVAVGAQKGMRLGLDSEDVTGVLDGLDFLRHSRRGPTIDIGSRIAVVGGGDVAMDCARSARRFTGDRVEIVYRRTEDQMPAHPEEIGDLRAEGITIRELVAPRRIHTQAGRLFALECTVMSLGETDASGRPRPVPTNETLTLDLDTLIVAIGQRADLGVFGGMRVATSAKGYLEVDPNTLETSISKVFAGGDLRDPGPSNIVDACGDGRRIARAILGRVVGPAPETAPDDDREIDVVNLLARRSQRQSRVAIPHVRQDTGAFDEVIITLASEDAVTEARRCLDCDLMCSTCEGVCPNRAILTYRQEPGIGSLPRIPPAGGGDSDSSSVSALHQQPQIAVVADFCNECGNCVGFCPTAGRPWRDKPRLYLNRGDFENQDDNAFMLLKIDGSPAIQGRFHGQTLQLVLNGEVLFQGPNRVVRLAPESLRVIETTIVNQSSGVPEDDSWALASLFALLRGLTGSMPHFPALVADPAWLVRPV